MWPFDVKKKKRQIQKRRKVLLFTFIPITLIAIAIAVVLSLLFSCKPNDSSIITQKTIKEKNYMVSHNTDVFVSQDKTMKFGHDLFNLKAWSLDHDNSTDFIVGGTVDFGFLVDFDMDCHLSGTQSELMQWEGIGNGCGVVVGSVTTPQEDAATYSGDMDITSTMRFDIFGTSTVYGVYFFDTASESAENINGVFEIKVRGDGVKNAFGICFDNSSEGNLIVNGEWNIANISNDLALHCSGYCVGILFKGLISGMIDIGGAFNVSATYPQSTSNSADGSAMGFAFPFHAGIIFDGATITSRSVIVSGIFNLSFVNTGAGVIFASTNSSTCNNLIVSGQFYINVNHSSTSSACFAGGVDFSGISWATGTALPSSIVINSITINGVFFMFSDGIGVENTFISTMYVDLDLTCLGEIKINGVSKIYAPQNNAGIFVVRQPAFEIPKVVISGVITIESYRAILAGISQGVFSPPPILLSEATITIASDLFTTLFGSLDDGGSSNVLGTDIEISGCIISLFSVNTILLKDSEAANNFVVKNSFFSMFRNGGGSDNLFRSSWSFSDWENVQFFANFSTVSSVFQPLFVNSFWWNGTETTQGAFAQAAINSPQDPNLTLQNINDTESNFSVKVIGTCGTLPAQIPSKANFNSAFKQSLTTYKDSDDCPTTAKQWLIDIINNIPLS